MSGKQSWILIYRKIRDSDLWPDNREFTDLEAWIDLLMLAEYEEKLKRHKGRMFMLKRGQVFASQRFLANRWKWSSG